MRGGGRGGYGILISTHNNSLFKISLCSTLLRMSGCQENEEKGRIKAVVQIFQAHFLLPPHGPTPREKQTNKNLRLKSVSHSR